MSLRLLQYAIILVPLLSAAPLGATELSRDQEGVQLTYRDVGDTLDASIRERIITTFFHAYPRERHDFNPAAASQVLITIDPGYDGIAYVDGKHGATMTINPAWLRQHPSDTDLVSHEAMHIAQAYPHYADDQAPGWLVEGIADYARDRYGLDNAASGWALPGVVKPGQHYDSGYRVTGAFLKWCEARHPGLIVRLDDALRGGHYSPATWRQASGEDLAALWQHYLQARGGVQPAST